MGRGSSALKRKAKLSSTLNAEWSTFGSVGMKSRVADIPPAVSMWVRWLWPSSGASSGITSLLGAGLLTGTITSSILSPWLTTALIILSAIAIFAHLLGLINQS